MSDFIKNTKYQSLLLIGLLLILVALIYNFSILDIHKDNLNIQNNKKYSGLIVPSYNEKSYISEKNKLNKMVYHIDNKQFGNCDFENKKKNVMDIHNLCYHDIENDKINELLVPKNLHVTP